MNGMNTIPEDSDSFITSLNSILSLNDAVIFLDGEGMRPGRIPF